ncbi:SDR family NAD(P)-dependent oxidoreductase [Neptunomonas concharum]|uniref:SDR family NAD(P)-dependent oxidoreductase n=1 Tax=Neptunomonas concharum TaxID=1031538 RepID=A0A5P1R6I7_9GAMM|nr:SDR family NAD(P)-dependent oxidoreductase [Neptunomonas concharum]QEQ95339.1 SDR family NAD(P)-dependent oxidoreductase [Neptunomonas concharum]
MNNMPTVWITGASQGIGEALSLEYASQGYHVYASARSTGSLHALAQHATQLKGEITPLPLDITDSSAVNIALHSIDTPIDIAILNAGTHRPQSAVGFQCEDLRQLMELNLLGTGNCLEHLIPIMLQQTKGQIAIVASLAGYRGLPDASGYGATKAALINLAESLKLDLENQGIDIRIINPGFVKTPLTDKNTFPMPDLMNADSAAKSIRKGLQGKQFEVRFPWRFATVMGFLRWLPASLYFPWVRIMTGKGK